MLRHFCWGIVGLLMVLPTAWAGVGSVSLIDAAGLECLINTDVTFATSSNASGAAMDAICFSGVGVL